MTNLYSIAKKFVFKLDPETAHNATLKMMRCGLLPHISAVNDPALATTFCGLNFANPVGLSAGFDKNAEVIAPILNLGFGFTEVGTVTPKAQKGNPKPRVFREVENEAVINRMGFPNDGLMSFRNNLEGFIEKQNKPNGIVGINIGMNKNQTEPEKDYIALLRILAPMADYLTVNISSPNTPGLRDLQRKEFLMDLIGRLKDERAKVCGTDNPPPLLVKLAPDLSEAEQQELAETAIEAEIDGLILTNTTLDRPDYLPEKFRNEGGGLSGVPVREKSTATIRNFYALTKGKIPIIGVGGISDGASAYEKIKAGASLVQLYSSLVFKGPRVAHSINTDLLALLRADGYSNISEAIGVDHK